MKNENGFWIAEQKESQEHINRYVFASQYAASKVVLDAACGSGFGARILGETAAEVVAIDAEPDLINQGKNFYKSDNIIYQVCNVIIIPFADNYFDVAVSLETIEHLDRIEQGKFLAEIKRVVKPRGVIVVSTPDKTIWRKLVLHQHDHKRELTREEFQSLLGEYFSKPVLYGQRFYHNEKAGFLRQTLMFLKKIDALNLRRLVSHQTRRLLDASTSPLDEEIIVRPIRQDALAACMIAVSVNKK